MLRTRTLGASVVAVFTIGLAVSSSTPTFGVVDFEITPSGGIPVDDDPLPTTSAYSDSGVLLRFGFDTDGNGSLDTPAAFERAGSNQGEPHIGFAGSAGQDTADPGFETQLGDWFLRSPLEGMPFGKFVIQYTSSFPVTAASGELWDIDGNENIPVTEQYRVQAFDAGGTLLGTLDSPLGVFTSATAPLDGRPWVFSFSNLSASIDHIEITFTGTKTMGIGLAFNNFYPTTASVPEPSTTAMLLGLGSIGLLGYLRRRCWT